MKYLAVIDDSFLSNFRLDDNGLTLVVQDKVGATRAMRLKPLKAPTVTTTKGESVYITYGHIDAMPFLLCEVLQDNERSTKQVLGKRGQHMKINNLNDFITSCDTSGYESPIRMIVGEMETKMEADTMSVIQRYGIDVDKEELIKALAYDRQQYENGFKDAQSKLKPMCKYLTKCMSHPDISREYYDWCVLYGEDCNCQCCSR